MTRIVGTTTPWAVLGTLAALSSTLLFASWASGESNDLTSIRRAGTYDLDAVTEPRRASVGPRPGRCPDGFPKATLRDGAVVCSPFAGDADTRCPPGEARFPGERSCAPIGRACDAERDPSALHVRSGDDAAGGFASLAEALDAAQPGDVIELGAGSHVAPARIDRAVEIRGACARETHLVVLGPTSALEVAGEVSLSNLDVVGALVVDSGARLSVRGASVRSEEGSAITLRPGSELVGSRTVVRGETAISAEGGAELQLDAASLEGGTALRVRGSGAHASIERVALTASGPAALSLSDGARLEGDRVVVRGRSVEGIRAEGAGTELTLRWVFVPPDDGPRLVALRVLDDARASIDAARLEAGGDARVVIESGATLRLSDSFVSSDGRAGEGVRAEGGAHVLLERVDVRSSTGRAIRVESAYLVARGLQLGFPSPGRALPSEAALEARGGAQVEIWGARVDRPITRGLVATGDGTSLTIHDVSVRSAQRSECATAFPGCDGTPGGDALAVLDGAALRADHVRVEGSRGCGIVVAGAWTTLDLVDAQILDNRVGLCADGAEPGALRIGTRVFERGNESSFARPAALRVASSE